MKEYTDEFLVHTEYASYPHCYLVTAHYCDNDVLAVQIMSKTEGPIATITVNLDSDMKLKANESFVDTNNCPWAIEFIEANCLGRFTGKYERSGFCTYPLYEFFIEEDE